MSPPDIADDALVEEQEEVNDIWVRGMHPLFHSLERLALLSEVQRSAVITPLLARLYVALKDAHERIERLEEAVDVSYDRGYAAAQSDKAEGLLG